MQIWSINSETRISGRQDSYVSTVELNTATIQKYIREQEKQDKIENKLNTKEYEDPFKGSR